jgi:hypothetical protein
MVTEPIAEIKGQSQNGADGDAAGGEAFFGFVNRGLEEGVHNRGV